MNLSKSNFIYIAELNQSKKCQLSKFYHEAQRIGSFTTDIVSIIRNNTTTLEV